VDDSIIDDFMQCGDQGLNCASTVRYRTPASTGTSGKGRDRTGTSTARGSSFPRSRAEKFYWHGSKCKSRPNETCRHRQLDIDQVRLWRFDIEIYANCYLSPL